MADALPLHLDVEVRDRDAFHLQVVFCRILGCRWELPVEWEDLDLGEIDWPKEHPEHG